MTVYTPSLPDFTSQDASTYKSALDSTARIHNVMGGAFAPHQTGDEVSPSGPDMTVTLESGYILNGTTLTSVAAQTTGVITAPVSNPRIDRVVIDGTTGAVSVIAGSEAASPTAPAITSGKLPVAQILLQTSSTSITNLMITDERVGFHSSSTVSLGVTAGSAQQVDQSETSTGSATTTTLGTTLKHLITGTTTITAFNGVAGVTYHCTAGGAFTLTHNATNLDILQTGASITTAADDTFDVYMRTASTCEIRNYQRASGEALVSSNGWSFVSSATASASASVAFTGLSTGYDYQLEAYGVAPATDAVSGEIYLGVSGPTYRTTNYIAAGSGVLSNATSVASGVVTTYIPTDGNVWGNAATEEGSFIFTFFDPAAATATRCLGSCQQHENSTHLVLSTAGGQHTVAEAMDAIKFQFSAGNIASGVFKLYRRPNA